MGDLIDLGAESALSFADEPVIVLHERIDRARRYTVSWLKAVRGSVSNLVGATPLQFVTGGPTVFDAAAWEKRIKEMQAALAGLLVLMPLSDVFPGNDAVAAYERVSANYAQLYRELALSMSSLPQRGLLDQLGDLGDAIIQAPAEAAASLADAIARAIARAFGGAAGALWTHLWPWLLVGGAAGVVYVFRAPIGRALGKVAA